MINGKKTVILRIAVFMGMTAALFFPRQTFCEERSFMPSVENLYGSLELDMRRIETARTTNLGNNYTDLYQGIERLRLGTDGYVYHPRFMIFHLGGAVGLDQGYYKTPGYFSRTSHAFDEYDFIATLLPEHPYNLEVFSRRAVLPLSPSYPQENLATSYGASFRYREKPLTVNLSTVSQSLETGKSSYDSTDYSAGATHVIGPVSNAVRYSHGETQSSSGTQAVRTNSIFNNSIKLTDVYLASSIGTDRQNQTNPSTGTIETAESAWTERLHADLPINLSAELQHEYRRNELTFGQLSSTQEPTTFDKKTADYIILSHMLYQSLRTTYTANKTSIEATGGSLDSSQEQIAFAYVKNIPAGALNANYSYQDLSSTRIGTPVITSERHPTIVPGTFVLSNLAPDPSTITVMVTHPVTQNLVPLTRNVNYLVTQFGNVLQITILSLPNSIVFVPGTSYDFTVSYYLQSTDSITDMRTNAYHLGLVLFNGQFSPFVGLITSDVNSSFGGIPINDIITSITYGYNAQLQPFTFFTEYNDYRSRISPSQSVTAWTEYRQLITDDTDIIARLTYNETNRPITELSPAYSEKFTIVDVSARKSFPREHLNVFIGGSYSKRRVTGLTATSYELHPSLQWHIGMLDVSASVSKSFTVTAGTFGNQSYMMDTYYLTVSRKLF